MQGAVDGLVFQAAESAFGVPGGGGGTGFRIDPKALEVHAQTMHQHAEKMAGHAQVFPIRCFGSTRSGLPRVSRPAWAAGTASSSR